MKDDRSRVRFDAGGYEQELASIISTLQLFLVLVVGGLLFGSLLMVGSDVLYWTTPVMLLLAAAIIALEILYE